MAEIAEELSFDSVWVGDSLIDSPRYEPLTLLGAVSAKTKKVKIGSAIIQPHFRNPILLALAWATLDRLSNGRTILALGTGGGTPEGVAKEAELVGIDVKKRGKALEENVEILRTLWRGETLNHYGEVYKMEGAKIGYFPIQNPPPIWIAAGIYVPKTTGRKISATPGFTKSEGVYFASFGRVAKLADGWFTIMASPEDFERNSRKISDLCREYHRRPNEIKRAVECWLNIDSTKEKSRNGVVKMIEGYFASPVDQETVERWSIYGTIDDCIEKIERYSKAGTDLIQLKLGSEAQIPLLHEIGKSILPSF
jgi:alkanesulfonate monooxygenase SsuD/methylene tetrahydromethanopterin reductase-like flavin-dependent oxidoreductase (luciferase family)